ncbi:hypothetical protein [Mesorhizobium sp. LNHC209A00]|uniref:hypothetical protein n=1 Tax=Mesorhizobium TaxID=68287 RepID=UPI0018DD7FAC|nr:hypothetical protein [Mesorhizobium sp. LNHC209A00]
MERLERDAPLPVEMQGRWIDVEDSTSALIVQGGEIICFGEVVSYDYKLVDTDDGALTVSLKINDQAAEDRLPTLQHHRVDDYAGRRFPCLQCQIRQPVRTRRELDGQSDR